MYYETGWLLQAALAEVRMAEWGGKNENLPLMETTHKDNHMAPAQGKMLAHDNQKNVELVRTD
jgi:MATE family multidrug resistance protein